MNTKTKSAMITIAGRPNVGKSTLTNRLVGEKVAIVSNKPQTTRNRICGIVTRGDTQFVFMDTPGFHKPRTKLGDYMVEVTRESVSDVDAVILMVEPIANIGTQEQELLEAMKGDKTPVILVINKIDTVKVQEEILTFIAAYKDVCDFAEIVPLSALKDKNTDVLLEQIFKYLPYGPQFYDEDTVTDQPMKQIVAELIREKALHALNDEIPHGIAVVIDSFKERRNARGPITDIDATIICERDSHKGIIIGKKGSMLKKIGTNARYEIEQQLEMKVNLQLWVKVRKDWRDSELLMKNYGYIEEK